MTDANNATSTQIVTPYNGSWKLTIPEEKPYKVSITHNVDPEFLAEIVYLKNTVIYAQGDSDLSKSYLLFCRHQRDEHA
jgi:hypothetical protein